MSANGGDSAFQKAQTPQSGVKAVLQYTGIPLTWLDKRPRLPSRNWLIFLGVTSSVVGWYVYDRRQSKKIRQEYVDKVKHLSEDPLHSLDYPRKVTVYGARWPGDEEYDRSMKYFRKYVKPILNAAAVDFDMVIGRRHGDIASRIADEIKTRRRIAAGLDDPPQMAIQLPNSSPEAKRRRELAGGIVIVGRPTFKEFMAGLKRGWTEGLEKVDPEEALARTLEGDGKFDEPESPSSPGAADLGDVDGEPIPTPSKLPSSKAPSPFTPPHLRAQPPAARTVSHGGESIPSHLNAPPATIPPMPPILLVSFVNYLGFLQIPHMLWEFFNERHKTRAGAEAAYRLIMGQTRPFAAPAKISDLSFGSELTTFPAESQAAGPSSSDLDFDKDAERYYKGSFVKSFESDIEKARESYYEELPKKLETARALSRGEREPTSDEQNYPPPTEVELRAERMKKELRWRADLRGWDIIKPQKEAEWDERFRDVLQVFVDPVDVMGESGSIES